MNVKERFKLIPAAYLILIKDGMTLLSCRANTGYEDGNYGLVSGHIDGNETASVAVCREAYEESGLRLDPDNVSFVHLMHRLTNDERMDIFFTVETWNGQPVNAEPEKCSDLGWFPLNNLPRNTIPYVRHALECYQKGVFYSEYGWDNSASSL